MKADILISRLQKVRETSRGNWIACCPAHADKNPSMTVKDDDGTVLVHCFAGCSVEQILDAVGLSFDALFPDTVTQQRKPLRRPFNAHDVLAALETEAMIVSLAALDMGKGKILNEDARKRLLLASRRVREGVELANG